MNVKTISVDELKKMLTKTPTLCLIDVRELDEWQEVHIPEAIHIPKNELASKIVSVSPKLEQPVYIHCRSGVRSADAAILLSQRGYQQVYSITGGIMEWIKQGYTTDSLH